MPAESAARRFGGVTRRICVLGEWTLESPAHFGGDDGSAAADMCLVRGEDGLPYVPGASIAGALRSYLCQRVMGAAARTKGASLPPEVEGLFGGQRAQGQMSRLFVFDAHPATRSLGKLRGGSGCAVRDGVRLDDISGLAVDGAKFDTEVIERGVGFAVRMECVVREGDDESLLRSSLACVLDALGKGEVALGARTRRGYGRGLVRQWNVREIDPANREDLCSWLAASPCPPEDSGHSFWEGAKRRVAGARELDDQRGSISFSAVLDLETSLLVRQHLEKYSEKGGKAPDVEQVSSGGTPVVPGTSVAGLLRHRMAFIAGSLWGGDGEAVKEVVSRVFGPLHEEGPGRAGVALHAGDIRVDEGRLDDVEPYPQVRVAIDRFTGGALDHALFTEQPVRPKPTGGKLVLRAELAVGESAPKLEAGLLFLAFKDVLMGRAPVGGEASVGRGAIAGGTVAVEAKGPGWSKGGDGWTCVVTRKGDELVAGPEGLAELQALVQAAQAYPPRPSPDTKEAGRDPE